MNKTKSLARVAGFFFIIQENPRALVNAQK